MFNADTSHPDFTVLGTDDNGDITQNAEAALYGSSSGEWQSPTSVEDVIVKFQLLEPNALLNWHYFIMYFTGAARFRLAFSLVDGTPLASAWVSYATSCIKYNPIIRISIILISALSELQSTYTFSSSTKTNLLITLQKYPLFHLPSTLLIIFSLSLSLYMCAR